MRRTTIRSLALVAALTLAVASCGGDGDGSATTMPDETASTGGQPTPESTPAAPNTTLSPVEPVILISGFAFEGPTEVARGTTVTLENLDSAAHTWTSVDDVFDSGRLARGETFEFRFDHPGEYEFFCQIHPTMTGKISVEG